MDDLKRLNERLVDAILDSMQQMVVVSADTLAGLDEDRVGMALQAIMGGVTIPPKAHGWDERMVVLTHEFVRRLREGVDSDAETPPTTPDGRRLEIDATRVTADWSKRLREGVEQEMRWPWTEWEQLYQMSPTWDGSFIADPDGFRHGKPTQVTWREFLKARAECTLGHRPRRVMHRCPICLMEHE